ncbi:MAG TPA: NAD(P)-binding protein [Myxococcota bacterium]|nr:NAD(P)-binding protein [Myxococcota bacterium]
MARIAVVGGSVAGLAAALLLARDGHAVTVLERDRIPQAATPVEAFAAWERRGAPQVRHSHAFLARLHQLLVARAPDVLAQLLAAGAEELRFADLLPPTMEDRSPRPGDDALVMLACRRVTFEWVLRRVAAETPGVALRDGVEVLGLEAARAARPLVRGVRLRGEGGREESLAADLVVDASGRRSKLPAWLAALGAPSPAEAGEDCGIFYCSRFYRLRPGAERPQRDTTIGADLGYLKYAIFHGDGGIFSITFAASPDDAPLRALLREAPFELAAAALPATRPWRDPDVAEAITGVHGMAQLRNVRRRYVADGRALAAGVVAIGDASIHTNPLYGRGCTFAVLHAALLCDALREHPDDPEAMALALEAATGREIVPWYELSRTQDRDAIEVAERWRRGETPDAPVAEGGAVDPKAFLRGLLRHGLVPALRSDADVSRAFFRSFNLLDAPGDLMRDPAIVLRVLEHYRRRHEREDPVLGPGRSGMLEVLARAA